MAILIAALMCLTVAQTRQATSAESPPDAPKVVVDVKIAQGDRLREWERNGRRRADRDKWPSANLTVDQMLSRKEPKVQRQHYVVPMSKFAAATDANSSSIDDPTKDPVTLQECATVQAAADSGGYIKNHFAWCERWALPVAEHVWRAQHQPETTFPKWPGKTVPGGFHDDEVLTRNYYDKSLRDASSARVRKECRAHWPNYSLDGLDCDEYPFNSTYEAAGNGTERFSALPVPLSENRRAGELLGRWYVYDRILDKDQFDVDIYK